MTAPKDDDVHVRNIKEGGMALIDASIPLELTTMKSAFPFHMKFASAAINLNSEFTNNGNTVYSPNSLIHKENPEQQICICTENSTAFEDFGKKWTNEDKKSSNDIYKLLERIDKASTYNLLSPYPEVYYEHKPDKKCNSRFHLVFYVVELRFGKIWSSLR